MKYETEMRLFNDRKESFIERYIDSVIAGDIKNLTIKEEWIMLDKFYAKKEEYVAKLEQLKSTNIDVIVEEKLNEVKEQIRAEVVASYEADVKLAEEKVAIIDEMIAEEEAKLEKQEQVEVEAIEEVNQDLVDEYIGG